MAGETVRTQLDHEDEYWHETRRPLVCLLFLMPLLVVYEIGVLWVGQESSADVRNRADFWMRRGLEATGLDHPLVLPGLVVAILLGWHAWSRSPWRVRPSAFVGMLAESLLFAFALMLIGQLVGWIANPSGVASISDLFGRIGNPSCMAAISPAALPMDRQTAALAVSFLGAGLYEEVLFRLTLLPATFGLLRLVRLPRGWAGGLAVLLTGVAFAAAHHVEVPGEPVPPGVFAFRMAAGVFFAGLFYWRGFGIAVGAHAAYDLLVGIVLAPAAV